MSELTLPTGDPFDPASRAVVVDEPSGVAVAPPIVDEPDFDEPAPVWRDDEDRLGGVPRREDDWSSLPPRLSWVVQNRRTIERVTTLLVVAGVVLFAFVQLHPAEIFSSAVPTGGDMGAHVWAPAYLRDHLLPHGMLTGWSPDWYAGFPAYRYYMLPPALLIVALDVLIPYGTAFKVVAVLGILTLPICAWAFGKMARFAYPIPALFAVAAGVFLFDESFTIQGGNIASTMAGEFSFSIALSLSLLAFGFFSRGMESGRHRVLTAVLIALAALCHGIVMFFVAFGVLVIFALWADRKRLVYLVTTGAVALALATFWLAPFVLSSKYMTDMKYEGAPNGGTDWPTWWHMFFPHSTTTDRFWTVLAIIGFVGAIVRRHRGGAFLGVYSLVLTALVFLTKDGIPGFGLLWNTRLLPFLYLLRYFLGMLGMVELTRGVVALVRHARVNRLAALPISDGRRAAHEIRLSPEHQIRTGVIATTSLLIAVAVVSVSWFSWHLGRFPLQVQTYSQADGYRFEWPRWGSNGKEGVTLFSTSVKNQGFVDSWANWNFTGYVGKDAYAEYRTLLLTMKSIGENPAYGCGRAMWEQTDGDYGTPMALMLLPFWTQGCIGSMEGLYFESSATTPYHFLTAAAMSQSASNPVRGLAYENQNAAIGTRYLQTLGVRYYLAYTPEAVARADAQPNLVEIESARNGPWHVYLVAGSDLVVPMTNEPVVVNHRGGDQRERWLEVGASWFQHPDYWSTIPAADGPAEWQRVDVKADQELPHPQVDLVRPEEQIETKALPAVQVSNVEQSDQSIAFDVDQVGVPVIVRTSYFPNWVASGAEGPYRIAPNMMVVVPTSTHVRLDYKMSGSDKGAYLVTFLGLIALIVLWRRGRVVYPSTNAEPDAYGLAVKSYPGLSLDPDWPPRGQQLPDPPWPSPPLAAPEARDDPPLEPELLEPPVPLELFDAEPADDGIADDEREGGLDADPARDATTPDGSEDGFDGSASRDGGPGREPEQAAPHADPAAADEASDAVTESAPDAPEQGTNTPGDDPEDR
jgi:hypothetical protein